MSIVYGTMLTFTNLLFQPALVKANHIMVRIMYVKFYIFADLYFLDNKRKKNWENIELLHNISLGIFDVSKPKRFFSLHFRSSTP